MHIFDCWKELENIIHLLFFGEINFSKNIFGEIISVQAIENFRLNTSSFTKIAEIYRK